mmetsp:Transcript_8554/g.15158  ORF Transcript_8554/g.15158 Transcript_8554/m.15158 type:complete len:95 (+) Transcript_8554:162-446(+)
MCIEMIDLMLEILKLLEFLADLQDSVQAIDVPNNYSQRHNVACHSTHYNNCPSKFPRAGNPGEAWTFAIPHKDHNHICHVKVVSKNQSAAENAN